MLAHEPLPPAEPANNPTLNIALHRLNQALQAALHSIGDDVPEETSSTSEGADASAEGDDLHEPPAPPSEPLTSHTHLDPLDAESRVIESPQPHIETDQHSEPEPQTQSSPLGSSLSHTTATADVSATATATSDDSASATSIFASIAEPPTHVEPKPEPEQEPEPKPELGPDPEPEPEPEPEHEPEPAPEVEVDWAEARELEIVRLGSENARLRALLGIDPTSLVAAGIPDIDPEPPMTMSLFLHSAAQPPVAAGSSAWANVGAEPTNPFTHGFREDPSVLGLAATPSRLHALTPPNAPDHTTAADGATTGTIGGGGTLANRASGVFVSASWGPFSAGGGNGNGAGVGVGMPGQGPMAAQIQQQQKPPPPQLGIPGLARTMELQGPGVGGGGPGGGRGRGVLFGGRGRSVGW